MRVASSAPSRCQLPQLPRNLALTRSRGARRQCSSLSAPRREPSGNERFPSPRPSRRPSSRLSVATAAQDSHGEGDTHGKAWRFAGSAVFQLVAVRVDRVSHLLPEGLQPLSFLGYTIGGLFLASYTESPVGQYDEWAVLPATLWRPSLPPLLGAWGTSMVVTSEDAVRHGKTVFGLPASLGTISKTLQQSTAAPEAPGPIEVQSQDGSRVTIDLSVDKSDARDSSWQLGPMQLPWRLPLPSFSGLLETRAPLLHYNIWMACGFCLKAPFEVSRLSPALNGDQGGDDRGLGAIMEGQPICALVFRDMDMVADIPKELRI